MIIHMKNHICESMQVQFESPISLGSIAFKFILILTFPNTVLKKQIFQFQKLIGAQILAANRGGVTSRRPLRPRIGAIDEINHFIKKKVNFACARCSHMAGILVATPDLKQLVYLVWYLSTLCQMTTNIYQFYCCYKHINKSYLSLI